MDCARLLTTAIHGANGKVKKYPEEYIRNKAIFESLWK